MTDHLRFLGVLPRTADPREAARAARDAVRWCDAAGLDGMLVFTGAGAPLDPWVAATAIASTRRLVPLVALNPLYTHPYAAARALVTIGELYGRRVDLNLITGAALGELKAVGDTLDHRDRYARLQEYTELFLRLLDGRPVTVRGRFYGTDGLQLSPRLPEELRPRLYLAGHSADAAHTRKALGATGMGMLPRSPQELPEGIGALHLGVLTRGTDAAAQKAARVWFPDDPIGREMLELSLSATDSTWRRELAEADEDSPGSPVLVDPFRTFQADCPYLVGSYETVAARLTRLASAGAHTFVFDTPTDEPEYGHLANALRLLR